MNKKFDIINICSNKPIKLTDIIQYMKKTNKIRIVKENYKKQTSLKLMDLMPN